MAIEILDAPLVASIGAWHVTCDRVVGAGRRRAPRHDGGGAWLRVWRHAALTADA